MTKKPKADLIAVAAMTFGLIGVPALAIAQSTTIDFATDQRCSNGADVRLIEIRFASGEGSLPCKVVYRPEVESDTLGTVAWQGIGSVAACKAQADEVIGRLTAEGWSCGVDRVVVLADVDAALDSPVVEAEAERPAPGNAESDNPADDDKTSAALIEPTVYAEDSGSVDEEDIPAVLVDNPDLPPPSEELTALIEDDLARLDTTLAGVLEAQVAAYGDLNADDIDDALVLYTYTSPQPAYRQFLIAYVFDGETYQLTATRPVGGNISATMAAKVDAIDQGVIHLTLRAFEPGDASCCPSGTRKLTLALRDLDLVEMDAAAPTR